MLVVRCISAACLYRNEDVGHQRVTIPYFEFACEMFSPAFVVTCFWVPFSEYRVSARHTWRNRLFDIYLLSRINCDYDMPWPSARAEYVVYRMFANCFSKDCVWGDLAGVALLCIFCPHITLAPSDMVMSHGRKNVKNRRWMPHGWAPHSHGTGTFVENRCRSLCALETIYPIIFCRQLQLWPQRQPEILFGATPHILLFKKNGDLNQKHGNLMIGRVAAGVWFEPI